MKKKIDINLKVIRNIQVKILSVLLSAPFFRMGVYFNSSFDQAFGLQDEESAKFDVAWSLLKEEGVVYTEIHEIGIKADALSFADRFVKSFRRTLVV